MNKLLVIIIILCSINLFAQKSTNSLHNTEFWKGNPSLELLKTEIAKGNNPLEGNQMHMDAATLAINNNASTEVIQFLLSQPGIELNKAGHEKRTYLHWASMRGNVAIVDFLIKKGANIQVEDEHDLSPLYFAINNGSCSKELIDLFLKAGLDPQKKYKDGANLLLIAAPFDTNLEICNYLTSKGISIQSVDDQGATAVDYAARKGNIAGMKALLDKGVKGTNQALLMAAQGTRREANGVDVYRYLIEALKLKTTVTDKAGNSPLHLITRKQNQAEVAAYLLSKGADANARNVDGDNVLMLAAAGRDTELVKTVLPHTKQINTQNSKGVSALCAAVANSNIEIIRLLIDNKADIQVTDKAGNHLGYYLMQSYRAAGGRGGRAAGNTPQQSPLDAFNEKLQLLQSKGLELSSPQKDGSTLLHYAATKGDVQLAKSIYALGGIDINAQNDDGQTALHRAAITAQNDQILKYLLSIGADKTIKTSFDETAYDLLKNNEYFRKQNIDSSFLK